MKSVGGDKQAYKSFLEICSRVVRNHLRYIAQSKHCSGEWIEDLVQEVLISVHQKLHTYRCDLPILPWLFAVTRYRMIDSMRANNKFLPSEKFDQDFQNYNYRESTDLLSTMLMREEVDRLLQPLTERQKDILLQAKGEQVSLAEIGENFEMSESAVKVTVHRALSKIRELQE